MIQQTEDDIKDSEIKQAFELLEEKRLKQLFKDIENKQSNEAATIIPMFTWMKFAIAASVFGLIITSGILLFNNSDNNQLAFEKTVIKENIKNSNDTAINRSMAYQKPVINEIRNRNNISISVKTLDDLSEISEEYSISYRTVIPIDSINDVYAKYIFTNENLVLYLNEKSNVVVYQFNLRYYVKIENKYYSLMKSKNISSLKRIFDAKIIKSLIDTLFIFLKNVF
jgi:hypothetical protein